MHTLANLHFSGRDKSLIRKANNQSFGLFFPFVVAGKRLPIITQWPGFLTAKGFIGVKLVMDLYQSQNLRFEIANQRGLLLLRFRPSILTCQQRKKAEKKSHFFSLSTHTIVPLGE